MANVNRSPPPAAVAAGKSFAVTARESLESIVVAFALAFIFRAFIVEAFVIPTGSMAPTLYGQQITHTCSTCGFEYARGVEQSLPGSRPPDATLTCPNCGSTADQVAGLELLRPSSGDRILVHKWPFSVGGEFGPERWEVTVFKDPHNGTINYIKRLVGKPGEILEIIQGDVYTASLDVLRKHDPAVIAEMDEIRRELYRFAHGGPTLRQEDVDARYAAINKRIMPYLTIQRKALDAPDAQKSLWFNIYQQDFLPNYRTQESPESRVGWSAALLPKVDTLEPEQLNRGRIPAELGSALARVKIELPESPGLIVEEPNRKWRVSAATGGDLLIVREESRLAVYDAAAAEAWDTSQRTIRFKCESDQVLNLHFAGKPIDDFYGYNYSQNGQHPAQQRLPVGDLRLAFTWFPDAGDGGLVLEMNRDRDLFTARIRMDGTVQVDHLAGAAKVPVALGTGPVKLDPFALGRAVEVEFVNVDFRVSLTIDGREVVASTDKQYAPNLAELLSRDTENRPDQTVPSAVKIGAYRLQCRLDHVELDRDVYYRSSSMPEVASPPGQPTGSYRPRQNVFFRWPGWGTQGRPILLRDGDAREYFMLGDNSPGSKDSRLWWEIGPHLYHLGEQYQVGTVPEDQLIGQAFFVYWPGGYRRSWTADIGAIPNFGRMRWIR